MAAEKVNVTVDERYQDRFAEVVKRAKKAGLKVDQELDSIYILTGSIDSEKVDKLRAVRGVAAVESDSDIQLPPPNSPIQ